MKQLVTLTMIGAMLNLSSVTASTYDLYQVESSPYTTFIARKAGDLLTVLVEESALTIDNANSKHQKKDDLSFSLKKIFLPPFDIQDGLTRTDGGGDAAGVSFDSNMSYDAKAENGSKIQLKTTIEVRLIEEVNEGHFVIRGHRNVNINGKD
jgi:flagellar basal body L-ring protein FlgH